MKRKLVTVDAETLLATPMSKTMFIVDGLIPQGVNVLSGAAKIGKSWLMLWLGLQVSQGLPVWGIPTMHCDVLYLCLEDTQRRIKDRLFDLTNDPPRSFHLTVTCGLIGNGLEEEIINFLEDFPKTKLVIIDTLQKVRDSKGSTGKTGMYGNDYDDISAIKRIADEHDISIIINIAGEELTDQELRNAVYAGSWTADAKRYKDAQRDEVIRTVMKGLPLNVMYWCKVKKEDGSDGFEVLDGQQRTISLCEYVDGSFSVDDKYFYNLPDDKKQQILDYQLFVYVCDGTDSEKLEWFRILVHHLRKLKDGDDPFNEVSGSTGITGAADTNYVLKRKRSSRDATLLACGRDVEYQELTVLCKSKERSFINWYQDIYRLKRDTSAERSDEGRPPKEERFPAGISGCGGASALI